MIVDKGPDPRSEHSCKVFDALTMINPFVKFPCNLCYSISDLRTAIKRISLMIRYFKMGKCVRYNPYGIEDDQYDKRSNLKMRFKRKR